MPLHLHAWTRWNQRAARAQQTLRDLRTALTRPLGPPSRPGAEQRAPSQAGLRPLPAERLLTVVAVERPAPDAVTLVFAQPEGAPLRFVPGQFLTFTLPHPDGPLRRSYSICTDPADPDTFAVTARRVAGGRASNLLNDTAAPGMTLAASGPHGRFTLDQAPAGAPLLLIAGGAGITPLLAMVRALARRGFADHPQTTLLYGSRRADLILFRPELEAIAQAHPGAFALRLALDDLADAPPGALPGPLDAAHLGAHLPERLAPGAHAFLCGPRPMMDAAADLLQRRGLPAAQVHMERFASPEDGASAARLDAGPPRPVAITFARAGHTHAADTHTTLLDASEASPHPIPSSCRVGGCGACRVRVISGEVWMEAPNCLSAEEVEAGWRLACVGRPCGALTIDH